MGQQDGQQLAKFTTLRLEHGALRPPFGLPSEITSANLIWRLPLAQARLGQSLIVLPPCLEYFCFIIYEIAAIESALDAINTGCLERVGREKKCHKHFDLCFIALAFASHFPADRKRGAPRDGGPFFCDGARVAGALQNTGTKRQTSPEKVG